MGPALMRRLWPRLFDANGDPREEHVASDYESVPCLAALAIGSTGWVGWSEEKGEYWQCTKDDLTPEGRDLIAALRALYPGHEVVVTTWLDT